MTPAIFRLLNVLLLPYPARLRVIAWRQGIKIPYFKTAASLHGYLEAFILASFLPGFYYEQTSDTFPFAVIEHEDGRLITKSFRVSRPL
jgi:hypothetical protein